MLPYVDSNAVAFLPYSFLVAIEQLMCESFLTLPEELKFLRSPPWMCLVSLSLVNLITFVNSLLDISLGNSFYHLHAPALVSLSLTLTQKVFLTFFFSYVLFPWHF